MKKNQIALGLKACALFALAAVLLLSVIGCGEENGMENSTAETLDVQTLPSTEEASFEETSGDSLLAEDTLEVTQGVSEAETVTETAEEAVTLTTDTGSTEESTACEAQETAELATLDAEVDSDEEILPETEAQETEGEIEAETQPEAEDFEIIKGDGVAHVRTPAGLSYTLSGYTGLRKEVASFNDELVVTFSEDVLAEDFNRFSVTYRSSVALKVYVTYGGGDGACQADYFLEAGQGVFSGLVKDFLSNAKGEGVTELRIQPCVAGSATFVLSDFTLETVDVPSADLYIQNDAYRLGVDLNWGGTINYIRDRRARIQGLTNLVNNHDTGRLIQQSFYGTAGVEGEYQPGLYGEVQWVYNPVQGGDLYGNASRLIDLVVTETSVYIKAQPQDWSMNGQLTPSYMENTYTLDGDVIRVDNRFVDFSGWEHPHTSQELPALYTVSYLDTFVWYDGENGWTGDALSNRNDLPFWGDSAYGDTCSFPLKAKNTETWCAWMNTAEDYGIGLYVPNVDSFKAGRFEYNGTKDAGGIPCNYVAPLNTIKLVSFEALEYSYLLTTGSSEEIRSAFTANQDFATNESLHNNYISTRIPEPQGDITQLDFSTDENIEMLARPAGTTVTFDAEEGAAKLTVDVGNDPRVTLLYQMAEPALDASEYTVLQIEYMIPTTNSTDDYQCDLFLCVGDVLAPAEAVRVRKDLVCDGDYQLLEIDVSRLPFWSGDINQIRFDFFDEAAAGDVMYIRSIYLS